ncbi:MAG: GNAT family N-acetyltransferase [Gemmatimonadaceae bacterium]
MSSEYVVREATLGDVDVLAHHRAAMFHDMGKLPEVLVAAMADASSLFIARAMSDGEYHAWLASPAEDPGTIVAGAGLQLRAAMPTIRMDHGSTTIAHGAQGIIVNVYTEPAHRRHGVARLLMEHVIRHGRPKCPGGIVLHASDEGRPLYESLGFIPTNEMRLTARS